MKSLRDIRVIPVVLCAIAGLAVLKIAGLVIDGGYVFDYQPQPPKTSWAQENFNFPGGGSKGDPADITGSIHEKPKEEAKPAAAAPEVAKPPEAPRASTAKAVAAAAQAFSDRRRSDGLAA